VLARTGNEEDEHIPLTYPESSEKYKKEGSCQQDYNGFSHHSGDVRREAGHGLRPDASMDRNASQLTGLGHKSSGLLG
jgi:hypothetical protein